MKSSRQLITISLAAWCLACGTQTEAPVTPDYRTAFNQLRIYQIMVESFIDGDSTRNYDTGYGNSHHRGDLRGIIQALPYIKSLGMNAIWLTPIFDSEKGTGNDPRLDATGYFTRNYFAIDPNFGTLDDAREMVNTAHDLELYVFFDGVFGHHKGGVSPSPNGKLPVGPNNPVEYPGSLEFYKEVATYWIDELEIDGWRLDQAYQVPIAAWREIRAAVEMRCEARRIASKTWGTLGYMVAELWDLAPAIAENGYGTDEQPGLLSAFDFPLRYRLVQTLAVEENGFGHQPASVLQLGYDTHNLYPQHAVPNLMLGNHDLVRFGDLIQRAGYGGKETPQYWQRHRAAFSFLAAFTGPITIYYNEEIGYELEGYAQKVVENCVEPGLCDDHVARTSGKITGFTPEEEDLKNYLASLVQLREAHPALWNGSRRNLLADTTIFADLKTFESDSLLYVLNVSPSPHEVAISQREIGGVRLHDELSGTLIEPNGGAYKLNVAGLSGNFYIIE